MIKVEITKTKDHARKGVLFNCQDVKNYLKIFSRI
jgi:hypothetical protein